MDFVDGRRKTKARGGTWVRHCYSLSLVHSSWAVGRQWLFMGHWQICHRPDYGKHIIEKQYKPKMFRLFQLRLLPAGQGNKAMGYPHCSIGAMGETLDVDTRV